MSYNKYLKYKKKYIELKNKIGAGNPLFGPGITVQTTNMDFINKLSGLRVRSLDPLSAYNLLHASTYRVIDNDNRYELHDDDGYFAHILEFDETNHHELHHDDHGLVSKIDQEHYDKLIELFGNKNNISLQFKLYKDKNDNYYITINEV
jgi:hypothetical protein